MWLANIPPVQRTGTVGAHQVSSRWSTLEWPHQNIQRVRINHSNYIIILILIGGQTVATKTTKLILLDSLLQEIIELF